MERKDGVGNARISGGNFGYSSVVDGIWRIWNGKDDGWDKR